MTIVTWKMSDGGRTTGRWWEAAEIPQKRAFTLRFFLHPGSDTQVGGSLIARAPITDLDGEIKEIKDFRIATVTNREEAIRLGKLYEQAKNSGNDEKVDAFFKSVKWKIEGIPNSSFRFQSGEGELGVLMIVDWTQGKSLDLNAELSQD